MTPPYPRIRRVLFLTTLALLSGCVPNILNDPDADGIVSHNDLCPNTPPGATVDQNGCAASQLDGDADGVSDADDQCPDTPSGATVDGNGCAASQLDADGDGVSNADDQCADTPAGAVVDQHGCAASQRDTDGDGVNDANDQCPNTPAGQEVNEVGCTDAEVDSDGDGVPDDRDQCPDTPSGASVDENGCSSLLEVSIEGVATCSRVVYLSAIVSNASGAVTYSWAQVSAGSAGSVAVAGADSDAIAVTFSCDAAGSFTFRVTVADALGSATATESIGPPSYMCECMEFTPNADALVGTNDDNTFDGSRLFNAGTGTWIETVNTADSADGRGGTDTANIELNEGTTVIPTFVSIEILNITVADTGGGGGPVTFDASKTTGLTTVNAVDCSDGLNVINLEAVPALGIHDSDQSVTLGFDADAVSGAADAIDVTLAQVSGGTVTIPGVEVANIASTGTSANTLETLAMEALTRLVAAGSQDLTITSPIATGTFDELDAGAMTGGITLTFPDAVSNAIAISTGSGNDDITAGAAADVVTASLGAGNDRLRLGGFTDGADSADGGAGTDTIALPSAAVVGVSAPLADLTNFEVLELTDGLSGSVVLSRFGSIARLELSAGISGNSALTVLNGTGIVVEGSDAGAHTLSVTIGGTHTTDALTLTLANGGTAFGGLATLTGIESITIHSGGAAANTLTGLTFSPSAGVAAATITITGDQDLALGTVSGGTPITATALTGDLALVLAQAGAATGGSGNDTLTGSASADSLAGGDGDDVLVGQAGNDWLSGGSGNDVITGGTGRDAMSGGSGTNTFKFAPGDSGGAPAAGWSDAITDFQVGVDVIDFTTGDLVIVSGSAASPGVAAINAEGMATFAAADDTLAERIVAAEAGINASGAPAPRQFCIFAFDTDSYIFVSDGVDGIGANDVLIALQDVTGLSDTTLSGGDLTIH